MQQHLNRKITYSFNVSKVTTVMPWIIDRELTDIQKYQLPQKKNTPNMDDTHPLYAWRSLLAHLSIFFQEASSFISRGMRGLQHE